MYLRLSILVCFFLSGCTIFAPNVIFGKVVNNTDKAIYNCAFEIEEEAMLASIGNIEAGEESDFYSIVRYSYYTLNNEASAIILSFVYETQTITNRINLFMDALPNRFSIHINEEGAVVYEE